MSWLEDKDSEPEKCDRMNLQAIGRRREVVYKYGACNEASSGLVQRIEVRLSIGTVCVSRRRRSRE
jgi:hypothetical protein